MESKKKISSQTILEFGMSIVGNFRFSNLENMRKTLCNIFWGIYKYLIYVKLLCKLENIQFPTIDAMAPGVPTSHKTVSQCYALMLFKTSRV